MGASLTRPVAVQDSVMDESDKYSKDISKCGGYKLSKWRKKPDGLEARLTLIGSPQNAFGEDIRDLILEVRYETEHRLHVHIYDAAKKQYQIPSSVLPIPEGHQPKHRDLEFHHQESPFAFWITRTKDKQIIFDTRPSSIPTHPEPLIQNGKNVPYSELPSYPLVFSDTYLQLATAVPHPTNIYGLGEVIADSGIRRDETNTIATMWNSDSAGSPSESNLYGSHPFYLEHRHDPTTGKGSSHGVFMRNSHGMDVILRPGVIEYRILGGTSDMYFLAGPSPREVVGQYSEVVGKPAKLPFWAFGFHMCRWGWKSLENTKKVVERMREEGIPLEVIWHDLDYMDRFRNWETNGDFAPDKYREFAKWLHENNQFYVPIIDAAIGKPKSEEDYYFAYERGKELGIFIKQENGHEFVGKVWPGATVFPDWSNPKTVDWWKECFDKFRNDKGAGYDGIWLDMNEPASFSTGFGSDVPEGEIKSEIAKIEGSEEGWEAVGEEKPKKKSLFDAPPYPIHSAWGDLDVRTVPPSCIQADGSRPYNTHNMYGYEENIATRKVLLEQNPGKRPFILSRSTFAGQGAQSAHWLGDNYSTFASMRASVQGVLQFQMFQVPMVGPDACGFSGNTTEELASRWMQLSAFYPFYRNHNEIHGEDQEPYVWPTVAEASRQAIRIRYSLLPYWETLFHHAATQGLPPVNPLFFEFDKPDLFGLDTQFLVGQHILVTPVLHEGHTEVKGYFPSDGGKVTWRDWYTHEVVKTDKDDSAVIPAPLGHIPVHIRSGSIILVHPEPAYSLTETRQSAYGLIINMDSAAEARGEAVLDDGLSLDSDAKTLIWECTPGRLTFRSTGEYPVEQNLSEITLLGVKSCPKTMTLGQTAVLDFVYDEKVQKVVLKGFKFRLECGWELRW